MLQLNIKRNVILALTLISLLCLLFFVRPERLLGGKNTTVSSAPPELTDEQRLDEFAEKAAEKALEVRLAALKDD
jgi:hypothetical protein